MKNLEEEINRVWDIAVYLQMMAAFCVDLDFNEYQLLMLEFHETIKLGDKNEISTKLYEIEKKLEFIANPLKLKYPLKRNYREIAKDWNNNHKIDNELFSNGIMIGWLEQQLDLTNYYHYDYTPYQFKIGLAINKGRGEIEENFLLQDSFTSLVKAKKRIKVLDEFAKMQKQKIKSHNKSKFDKEILDSINLIKYDASFYSRLTVISFFSFLESFINSIGFDYYYRNKDNLNNIDSQILQGSKNGKYLNLKDKIEKFQRIIRSDKVAKIILSDNVQIKHPFKPLFENYQELRNASVHFSPIKERIWLKPHDWVNIAENLSNLIIEAALQIWQSCHQTTKGPDYLGRLEYKRLYEIAESRENKISKIENLL